MRVKVRQGVWVGVGRAHIGLVLRRGAVEARIRDGELLENRLKCGTAEG